MVVASGALVALDGLVAPWIAGAGAAAIGGIAALATCLPRGGAQARHGASATATGSAAPMSVPDAALVLRTRAIELRAEERSRLLDALSDAVLLVDLHGETRFVNEAAVARFGADATVAGTRRAFEQLPAHVRNALLGLAECTETERRRFEFDWSGDRAEPIVLQATRTGRGRDALVAVVVRDVRSEREADRMKTEFVSKASHELRTPLSSLRAYAEMIVDGEYADDAQHDHFMRIILDEADRLARLVDRMLDISRIESGIARADLAPTDLSALCRACVDEQQGEAMRRRTALSLARATAGATVPADAGLVKQVVLNLVSNALKYTPEGGRVEVEVDFDALAREVVVSVRDNGLGIPPEALSRLFGKFYRVDAHEKVAKGTGLGLNLCRNIVEGMHGGKIGVDSEVGRGSRFWFAIPAEPAARKAA
jgi:two-component system phosphate regulon sensor histidine kinase PhoR